MQNLPIVVRGSHILFHVGTLIWAQVKFELSIKNNIFKMKMPKSNFKLISRDVEGQVPCLTDRFHEKVSACSKGCTRG